jgi:hypothetical protein
MEAWFSTFSTLLKIQLLKIGGPKGVFFYKPNSPEKWLLVWYKLGSCASA